MATAELATRVNEHLSAAGMPALALAAAPQPVRIGYKAPMLGAGNGSNRPG